VVSPGEKFWVSQLQVGGLLVRWDWNERGGGESMAERLSILCFVAHPDDETVFFGGTMALLAQGGVRVHVVSATRGEGGEAGEPPVCARSELGSVREREMRCAVEALGARSLSFLGYRDPEMKNSEEFFPFSDRPEEAAQRLAALLRAYSVSVVVTHGTTGEYGHPANQLAHQVARLAVAQMAKGPALYGFSAFFPAHPRPRLSNAQDPADFVLDLGPVWERKLAAARCYVTQAPVFVRRISRERGYAVPLEQALMPLESLHRFLPGPLGPPRNPHLGFGDQGPLARGRASGEPGGDPLADWIEKNLPHSLVIPPGGATAAG